MGAATRLCLLMSAVFSFRSKCVAINFAFETEQLTAQKLEALSDQQAALFRPDNYDSTATGSSNSSHKVVSGRSGCKLFPGDAEWPSIAQWQALNTVVEGRLIRPAPTASVCYYNGTDRHDEAACEAVTASWYDSYTQVDSPIELVEPVWQGLTCQPPVLYYDGWNYGNCTRGGYPEYVVNVSTVSDVQAAINFARNKGIRLIIKNTGHDYSGKSAGAGSLSIWTHHLRDIAYIPAYNSSSTDYTGPAFKAGAGVLAIDMYTAARDQGLIIVGGECENIGIFGGYIQGGGHSPLASIHGMAADSVLNFEVITADGRLVSANGQENSELFWALRGGGGSTFGVVVSATVKAYPELPRGTASFSWSYTNANVSNSTFWAAYRRYLDYFPAHADASLHAYYFFLPTGVPGEIQFNMQALLAPNKTLPEADATLSPFFADLRHILGFNVSIITNHFDSYFDAWRSSYPLIALPGWLSASAGSRLWPRENWSNSTILNATFSAQKATVDAGNKVIAYNFAPLPDPSHKTSVNPAWRNTLSHFQTILSWDKSDPPAVQNAKRAAFEEKIMDPWRRLSPRAGAYLNEADRIEPNFQWAFWGHFYPELLELKKKYDPRDVFWAATAVGSEWWEVKSVEGLPNEDGRLCLKKEDEVEQYVAMT